MTNNYIIKGLTCNGCRTTVENLLSQVIGFTKASVLLESETAIEKYENDINFEVSLL